MTEISDVVSRLGSQADLLLTACRGGATVNTVTIQIRMLVEAAKVALDGLGDVDPNAVIEQDIATSPDVMAFVVSSTGVDAVEFQVPDDLSDLTSRTVTDDEAESLDISLIHSVAREAGLAAMVTTRPAVDEQLGREATNDEWRNCRDAVAANPLWLTILCTQLIEKED